jgi:23S rRNA (pseudouridine1915-N3)-methyltransferase
MKLRVIAVGTRVPPWVREGYAEYSLRLQASLKPVLLEIEPGTRPGGSARRALESESRRLLAALKPAEFVVVLDEQGIEMSSVELAEWLGARMRSGQDLAFLIGGPDGFAPEVRARGDLELSLSRLTLPHALARVVLAEQIYRAHSLMIRHPYHRA